MVVDAVIWLLVLEMLVGSVIGGEFTSDFVGVGNGFTLGSVVVRCGGIWHQGLCCRW